MTEYGSRRRRITSAQIKYISDLTEEVGRETTSRIAKDIVGFDVFDRIDQQEFWQKEIKLSTLSSVQATYLINGLKEVRDG